MLPLSTLLLLPAAGALAARPKPNVVGWYDGRAEMMANVPVASLNLSAYTHIVMDGAVGIEADGSVSCTTPLASGGGLGAELRNRTLAAGVMLQTVITDDGDGKALFHSASAAALQRRFVATARAALLKCGCDGIEFDYEGPDSNDQADAFTDFLVALKAAVGPKHVISADISDDSDFPYVNPKLPGFDTIDFLNVMT